MNQPAAMSVDDVAVAGMLDPNLAVAVWFVSEDEHGGRYRKFPPHLNELVEEKFVQWQQGGRQPGIVVEYHWQNRSQTSSQKYEITFEDMRQVNMTTNKVRVVERYIRG